MSGGVAATAVRHRRIRQRTAQSGSGGEKRKKETIKRRNGIMSGKVWKWWQKKIKGYNQPEKRQREWWHGSIIAAGSRQRKVEVVAKKEKRKQSNGGVAS